MAAEVGKPLGWYDVSTLKEPYRVEGKKTMGYELAEQLGWRLPDWIIYPTGGGTGLVGMWKAFDEMEAIGWIPKGHRPRMVSVQAAGCAPIVRAFEQGTEKAAPWENAHTSADGLRVPRAIGDFLILEAVRKSGGTALAVTDEQMALDMLVIGCSSTPAARGCHALPTPRGATARARCTASPSVISMVTDGRTSRPRVPRRRTVCGSAGRQRSE